MQKSSNKSLYILLLIFCFLLVFIKLNFESTSYAELYQKADEKDENVLKKMMERKTGERERRVVVGIFATIENYNRREAQRETWLASSKIEHKYLIDKWTEEWRAENEVFGDIVNVNASFNGYAKGYGEKLYKWYEYVAQNYPAGTIVGKTDDDFYGCANLYDVVIENYHPRMYFGWWHPFKGDLSKPSLLNRPDGQFILIGWELMKEVITKPYCHHKRDASFCKPDNDNVRYGNDFGDPSLGHWLGQIGNITQVRMNDRMVHTQIPKQFRSPVKKPFCGEMISYHKTTPPLQRYLECYDQDIPSTKQFCNKAKDMSYFAGKPAYKPEPRHPLPIVLSSTLVKND